MLLPRATGELPSEDLGFGRVQAPPDQGPEAESVVYVPVLPAEEVEWRSRIGGVIGLLLIMVAAALAVALGIYQFGHALSQTAQRYLGQ